MAIDSSIWIYQFQATMRDKEGHGLVNAHVVGFLRRITKLLFYGIKPVFVFDGGAPALKMATIAERKNKKIGAAASHAKVAERLLAAQMRREALDHAFANSTDANGKKRPPPGRIDDNTVYLEDITGAAPTTPAKPANPDTSRPTPLSSGKKSKWRDHDPYRLPEVNMDAAVAKATAGVAPDPRLATEDELRTFIEEMRPEDFDVNSEAFRELPTELQYEIIGDLRLKSRQTSYKRLQSMLKVSKTPLDFSKEQIKNLKQRNALTQQLLVTTDGIGKAHITIPVRIASERNKEYVLVKNDGVDGGWVLGIRDDGTAVKPIEIDPTPKVEPVTAAVENSEDEDDDMEDQPDVPGSAIDALYDPDLREFRRGQALAALAARYTPKGLAPLVSKTTTKKSQPLFALEDDELPQLEDLDDPELAFAMEESAQLEEEAALRRAIEESKRIAVGPSKRGESSSSAAKAHSSPGKTRTSQWHAVSNESDNDDDLYASPTRLETALSIGGAAPRRPPRSQANEPSPFLVTSSFGIPTLLLGPTNPMSSPSKPSEILPADSEEDDMEEVPVINVLTDDALPTSTPTAIERSTAPISVESDHSDDMEVVEPVQVSPARPGPARLSTDQIFANDAARLTIRSRPTTPPAPRLTESAPILLSHTHPIDVDAMDTVGVLRPPDATSAPVSTYPTIVVASRATPPETSTPASPGVPTSRHEVSSDSEDEQIPWSRSPSPTSRAKGTPKEAQEQGWDAAHEMDPHAEEDEYTRFLSQVRGKDVDSIRREIDEEIRELNKQRKNAMRDSEDITQQMISQIMIMLRLFGIPYITAPMEAEAQCAALLSLGLVDGIITDDSDVFLFGGARVLKNMFNQSKTVECFLLPDLERELGLDRDKLVRLAYLLGSDYTDGLPGVGPVVAMELLSEFPGNDGLHKFKAWWTRVQSGRDKTEESATGFRKRFKKKFKELYLADEWPNPSVRDAYYHPTVDESTEPFKWGMPDLDALRGFFKSELGWDQTKVDDLLLPVISKMSKRAQGTSTNAQGTLSGFFDVPLGANAAPRKRQAYASKRLQQVVSDFRKQQAKLRGSATPAPLGREGSEEEEQTSARPAKKRKRSGETTRGRGRGKAKAKAAEGEVDDASTPSSSGRGGRGKGRGRGRGGARASKKRARTPSDSEEDAFVPDEQDGPPTDGAPSREQLGLRPRPKPRPVRKPPNAHPEDQIGDVA
ncbi:PIN domain-like protein [Epithele typhae]|uniref:PIN domain-like protein n=1 Tax=Epithele typhae TaxID=378194 RepID=UPI002008BDE9|nr:PIN domain-like protein [Epithele typhae]KAH9945151.1 PIN domain-like protein [Epithele typhae]